MIYLVVLYILIVLFFAAYSMVGIYHLWRFGYVGDLTRPFAIVYSIVATAIAMFFFVLLMFQVF